MKFTTKAINAVLLTSYVARKGQTNLYTAAADLNISLHFLEQIARKLRVVGVLKSVRGPGGGYVLGNTNATIRTILEAAESVEFLPGEKRTMLVEQNNQDSFNALQLIGLFEIALNPVLDLSVTTFAQLVPQAEMRAAYAETQSEQPLV